MRLIKSNKSWRGNPPRWQSSWGQHGAHLGPVGARWAPCWPHEPFYQYYLIIFVPPCGFSHVNLLSEYRIFDLFSPVGQVRDPDNIANVMPAAGNILRHATCMRISIMTLGIWIRYVKRICDMEKAIHLRNGILTHYYISPAIILRLFFNFSVCHDETKVMYTYFFFVGRPMCVCGCSSSMGADSSTGALFDAWHFHYRV